MGLFLVPDYPILAARTKALLFFWIDKRWHRHHNHHHLESCCPSVLSRLASASESLCPVFFTLGIEKRKKNGVLFIVAYLDCLVLKHTCAHPHVNTPLGLQLEVRGRETSKFPARYSRKRKDCSTRPIIPPPSSFLARSSRVQLERCWLISNTVRIAISAGNGVRGRREQRQGTEGRGKGTVVLGRRRPTTPWKSEEKLREDGDRCSVFYYRYKLQAIVSLWSLKFILTLSVDILWLLLLLLLRLMEEARSSGARAESAFYCNENDRGGQKWRGRSVT